MDIQKHRRWAPWGARHVDRNPRAAGIWRRRGCQPLAGQRSGRGTHRGTVEGIFHNRLRHLIGKGGCRKAGFEGWEDHSGAKEARVYRFLPLCGRVSGVKVTDDQIREVMDAVRRRGVPVSGDRVRAELRARFGVSAGTTRLYRLVTAAAAEPTKPVSGLEAALQQERVRADGLQQALNDAIARAERAEYREQTHQESWAREVDDLRMKLRAEVERSLRPGMVAERELALRRQLLEAQQRIALLEQAGWRAD